MGRIGPIGRMGRWNRTIGQICTWFIEVAQSHTEPLSKEYWSYAFHAAHATVLFFPQSPALYQVQNGFK